MNDPQRIDCHCHAFPEAVLGGLAASNKSFAAVPDGAWDEGQRIAEMDGAGVALEVLSCPHIYAIDPGRLGPACVSANDAFAETKDRWAGRFAWFAHLPLHETNAAVKELERARARGCVGVVVPSNINGRYLDEPSFEPVWSAIAASDLPVLVHPVDSPCYRDGEAPSLLSWPFDTTLAVTRLITRGLFDRFPALALIVSHLGGTLPFIGHRLDIGYAAATRSGAWQAAHPPSTYLKRLYVDTALGFNEAALRCARDMVGIDRIVFGSDHFNPALPHLATITAFLNTVELPAADRQLIDRENARALLRL